MKPIQTTAKTLAAGAVGFAALSAVSLFKGDPNASLKNVQVHIKDPKLEILNTIDTECVELLSRLEPFQRFSKESYHETFLSMLAAAKLKKELYDAITDKGLQATSSFQIREAYQKVIESIRVFRAILEKKMPSAVDDFDEVAVDVNGLVESRCLDALHDSFT